MSKKSRKPNYPMPDVAKSNDDWRAEDDARTLVNAEKIKADKPRYQAACRKCKEQMNAHQNILAAKSTKSM